MQISHIFLFFVVFFLYGCTKKCRRIVFQKLQTDMAWGMLQKRSQDFRSFFLRTVGPAPKGPPEGIGSTIILILMVVKAQGGYHTLIQLGRPNLSQIFKKKTHSVKLPLPLRCFTVTLAKNLFFFLRALRKGKHMSSRKTLRFLTVQLLVKDKQKNLCQIKGVMKYATMCTPFSRSIVLKPFQMESLRLQTRSSRIEGSKHPIPRS